MLVLRNAGPIGAPGMPEAGYLPIPQKLAAQGVKDMVRISDARMSGTAFGTIVLHLVPEAAIGGPLALVRNGDRIRLDVGARRIELLVDEAELARRREALAGAATAGAAPAPDRGYAALFHRTRAAGRRRLRLRFPRPRPGGARAMSEPLAAVARPRVRLPARACDSHLHVIGTADAYPFDARRSYTPEPASLAQYREVMAACGIERAVLVQPSVYGTDNRCMLDALRQAAAEGVALRGVAVPEAGASDGALAAMHDAGRARRAPEPRQPAGARRRGRPRAGRAHATRAAGTCRCTCDSMPTGEAMLERLAAAPGRADRRRSLRPAARGPRAARVASPPGQRPGLGQALGVVSAE